MRLITAHKILIGAAIAMFAFLTVWEVRQGAMLDATLSAAATAALGGYAFYRFRG